MQAGFGAAASGSRRMLRAAKDTSVTVGVVVETPTVEERTAVLAALRNTIKSGIFPSRLNSAGAPPAAAQCSFPDAQSNEQCFAPPAVEERNLPDGLPDEQCFADAPAWHHLLLPGTSCLCPCMHRTQAPSCLAFAEEAVLIMQAWASTS